MCGQSQLSNRKPCGLAVMTVRRGPGTPYVLHCCNGIEENARTQATETYSAISDCRPFGQSDRCLNTGGNIVRFRNRGPDQPEPGGTAAGDYHLGITQAAVAIDCRSSNLRRDSRRHSLIRRTDHTRCAAHGSGHTGRAMPRQPHRPAVRTLRTTVAKVRSSGQTSAESRTMRI